LGFFWEGGRVGGVGQLATMGLPARPRDPTLASVEDAENRRLQEWSPSTACRVSSSLRGGPL
jgi:hypothetical protein